jgi:hypothetical protein
METIDQIDELMEEINQIPLRNMYGSYLNGKI